MRCLGVLTKMKAIVIDMSRPGYDAHMLRDELIEILGCLLLL